MRRPQRRTVWNGKRICIDRGGMERIGFQEHSLGAAAADGTLQSALASSSEACAQVTTKCWRLGLTVFAQYFLLALDIRFVASRNFPGIIIVNALIALMGWYVVRGIVEAHTLR